MHQDPVFAFGFVLGCLASSVFFLSFSYSRILDLDAGQKGLSCEKSQFLFPDRNINKCRMGTVTLEERGWKDVHVFFGDRSHIYDSTSLPTAYLKSNTWFSQYRQDEIVSRLLRGKRGGYFIDLAANDPIRISNTYALETSFAWNGLCVEPNPIYWTGLSYRKCHVVAAIVGDHTMEEITFRYPRSKAPQGGSVGGRFDNKRD